MPRSLHEWIGKTDDTPVPPRVRLRVFERFGRCCDPSGGCGRPIRPGDAWTCDHVKAIVNGGANRENNLHPLCSWCEPPKTMADVKLKSDAYHKGLRHAGIHVSRFPMRGGRQEPWKRTVDGRIVDRITGEPWSFDKRPGPRN